MEQSRRGCVCRGRAVCVQWFNGAKKASFWFGGVGLALPCCGLLLCGVCTHSALGRTPGGGGGIHSQPGLSECLQCLGREAAAVQNRCPAQQQPVARNSQGAQATPKRGKENGEWCGNPGGKRARAHKRDGRHRHRHRSGDNTPGTEGCGGDQARGVWYVCVGDQTHTKIKRGDGDAMPRGARRRGNFAGRFPALVAPISFFAGSIINERNHQPSELAQFRGHRKSRDRLCRGTQPAGRGG